MNRTDFLTRKPATKSVPLETDGQTYTIRKLSQADVQTMNREYTKPEKSAEGFRFIIVRGLCDEDGNRLLTDKDMTGVGEIDFDVVKELAAEIADFSGIKGVKSGPEGDASKNR